VKSVKQYLPVVVLAWELKFDNGVKGSLVVDKNMTTIDIPEFFKGEGGTGDHGNYVEICYTNAFP